MSDRPQNTSQGDWLAEYTALTSTVGLVDVSDRTIIELTGDDRATFLHNLSTNEIRKLVPGSGCEAFLTNVQGKILAHGFVFADEEALEFETVAGQAEKIIAHLDRYLIREKVVLRNAGAERAGILLAGPRSEQILAHLSDSRLPSARLASVSTDIGGTPVRVRCVDWTGPIGFLLECDRPYLSTLAPSLATAGAVVCGVKAFEAARIESGTPLYGLDISDKNLPQEVARDHFAISFTKGCYLGQETVARIDALGHVNRTLVGLRFDGADVPLPGASLTAAGQNVGEVTSATYSPRLSAPLALAYVRRGSSTVGSRLESATGSAVVIQLPP